MLIVGIIFFIIAIVIMVVRFFAVKKQEKLLGTERKKIGEVVHFAQEAKAELAELGEENLIDERGAFVGMAECAEPLIAPFSQRKCLYYKMEVSYKAVERYQERDSNGNMQTRTRTVTKTLESNEQSTRFTLKDDTGSVLVDPRDGIFEGTVQSYNKTEPYVNRGSGSASLSIGGFSLNLGGGVFGSAMPETLTSTEHIVELDRKLTVIGSVQDKMGELILEGKPKEKITISTYSMDELVEKARSSLFKKAIAAGVSAGIGVLFVILHIVL